MCPFLEARREGSSHRRTVPQSGLPVASPLRYPESRYKLFSQVSHPRTRFSAEGPLTCIHDGLLRRDFRPLKPRRPVCLRVRTSRDSPTRWNSGMSKPHSGRSVSHSPLRSDRNACHSQWRNPSSPAWKSMHRKSPPGFSSRWMALRQRDWSLMQWMAWLATTQSNRLLRRRAAVTEVRMNSTPPPLALALSRALWMLSLE